MDSLNTNKNDSNESEEEEEVVVDSDSELHENLKSEKLELTEPANSFLRYYLFSRGDSKAKCRICSKKIGRKNGSTNGMDKHLSSSIRDEIEAFFKVNFFCLYKYYF